MTSGATPHTTARSHSPRASAAAASATAAIEDTVATSTARWPPRKLHRLVARPATMLADVNSESGSMGGEARSTSRSRMARTGSTSAGAWRSSASRSGAASR